MIINSMENSDGRQVSIVSGYSASHRPPLTGGLVLITASWGTWVSWDWKVNSSSQTREEDVDLQGRAGDDNLEQFYQQYLYWHRKIRLILCRDVLSVQYQHPKNTNRQIISVWKIDIVDNIIKQASSINSVFCVHLGSHRTQGQILSYTQTDWFWCEGASVLSSEFHVQ